jgi:CheY-like chemotaxis protein
LAEAELAERRKFVLLVSDLGLPEGSGLDIMRRLRQSQRIAEIALSGWGMDEDLRKGREAGFAEHLVKPVTAQVLEDVIRRVTGNNAK